MHIRGVKRGWNVPSRGVFHLNGSEAPTVQPRRTRRLRPEVAEAWLAMKKAKQLQEYYGKPVDQLEPSELAVMRAAFLKG